MERFRQRLTITGQRARSNGSAESIQPLAVKLAAGVNQRSDPASGENSGVGQTTYPVPFLRKRGEATSTLIGLQMWVKFPGLRLASRMPLGDSGAIEARCVHSWGNVANQFGCLT